MPRSLSVVDAISRAVDAGVRFRAPATSERIARLEAVIGQQMPSELHIFYGHHDGADGISIAEDEALLSLDEVENRWLELRDVWSGRNLEPYLWRATWLPITYDAGGNSLCVELGRPDVGAVFRYWCSKPERPYVANSFTAWLETAAWAPAAWDN